MKQIQTFLYSLFLLLLTACGGGDPIGSDETTNPDPTPVVSVNLSIDNTAVDAANPAIISAQVLEDGNPVSGIVVSFSTDLGVFDIESATALTDPEGIARIGILAGTISGAGTVTGTISTGESDTVSFQTAGDASDSSKSLEISVSDTNVDNLNPQIVTVIVKQGGELLSGEVVAFNTQGGIGSLIPSSGSVLTDINGIAQITLTAGDLPGASFITATLSTGESASVGFESAGDSSSGVTVDLKLIAEDSLEEIQLINSTTPGRLLVTVTGISETVIVNFSGDIGSIPISTAITDVNNQSIVDIYAGDTLGAGKITAELTSGESDSLVVVVGATQLYMGSESIDVSDPENLLAVGVADLSLDDDETLGAGATMSVSVKIVDDQNQAYTQPIDVEFTSNCVVAGTSVISSPISTVNGVATSTYRADGCVGEDYIVVSAIVGSINLTANTTVNVDQAKTGSIEFLEASPEQISLRGVGGAETSIVSFKVLDINGNPVNDEKVSFSLNTKVGGIALDIEEAQTDIDGTVQTVINAGNVATSVRVTATVDATGDSTQSNNLVISTGIPDQDSFTIATDGLNIEAWQRVGENIAVTVYLADAFNNPAPDKTVVAFTTEGGSIEPYCLTGEDSTPGKCTVNFTSQNPYPSNGRITILATAIGEESFIDLNGNGRYDNVPDLSKPELNEVAHFELLKAEYDLPEAFIDSNENGVYDNAESGLPAEEFIDFNEDGEYNQADEEYTGSLCSSPDTCSANSLNVRGSAVVIMSSSYAVFSNLVDVDNYSSAPDATDGVINIKGEAIGGVSVNIADINDQPMAEGTTITFESSIGEVLTPNSYSWPRDAGDVDKHSGRDWAVSIKGEETTEFLSGTVTITVESPSGATSYRTLGINIEP